MKRILIVTILIAFYNSSIAQDYNISWEPESKKKKYFPDITLVRSDGGFYLISYKEADEINIFKYSKDAKVQASAELELKLDEKYYYETAFITPDDRVFILVWKYDFKSKGKTFKKIEIKENCTLGSVDPNFKLVLKVDSKTDGSLRIHTTPNKSKIYMELKSEKPERLASDKALDLKLAALDENYNVLKENAIKLPGTKKNFQLKSLNIFDNGNILVYYKSSTSGFTNEYLNKAVLYNPEGKIIKETNLDKDKFHNEFLIEVKNNTAYFYGFYSDKKVRDNLDGFSGFEYSGESGDFVTMFQNKLTTDILKNIMSEKKADKKESTGISNNFIIRKISQTDEQNFVLVAEDENLEINGLNLNAAIFKDLYLAMGYTNEMLGSTKFYNLYYENILVISFNSNGNINWSDAILKKQYFKESNSNNMMETDFKPKPNPSGSFVFDDDERVYVLFNDSRQNFELQSKENKNKRRNEVDNYKKANCYVFSFEKATGKKSSKMLFDGSENDLYVLPKRTLPLSEGEYIMYSKKFSKDAVGLLRMNNVSNSKKSNTERSKLIQKTSEQKMIESGAKNNLSKEVKSTAATINSTQAIINTPANTSAIAHGEARTPSAAVAKTYKYKADEKSVEYYNDLRKKFEEEEKIRKEKEAQLAVEKAKKEEEIKQGRRLTEDQAPQFDRFRQGEKNPVVKKTTAEEDYKTLFK